MELHFTPELEKRLNDLASKTGRAPEALVEDAMAGYLEDLGRVRGMLDSRYDDLKSGGVKPIDGEAFFGLPIVHRRRAAVTRGDSPSPMGRRPSGVRSTSNPESRRGWRSPAIATQQEIKSRGHLYRTKDEDVSNES